MSEERRPVLVAGKAGQLARCLQDAAARYALPLIAVGRPDLDVESVDSVNRAVCAIKPCLIVNAAAYTAVDKAESEPERAFAVNRDGAGRLAAAAAGAGIPCVHISTDYVFDGTKPAPYVEEDEPSPIGVYGRSKLEGEAAVRNACPGAVVLRTSWVYSPYGQNFVKTMLRLAQSQDTVRVVDDQHGTPTAAGDLASAILAIARRLQQGGPQEFAGVYHLTARGETTWHQFATAIFAGWKARGRRVPSRVDPIPTAQYPTPAERPLNSRLDCSRIERRLGIRLPQWSESLGPCLDALAIAAAETPPC